jgi:hypothetical protein
MSRSKDYSRQRLADFFAARLKARRTDEDDPHPEKRDPSPTTLPHAGEKPPPAANGADYRTRDPSPGDQSRHPNAGIGSSSY